MSPSSLFSPSCSLEPANQVQDLMPQSKWPRVMLQMTLSGALSKRVLSGLGVGVGVPGQGSGVGNPAAPSSSSSTTRGWVGVHGPITRVPTLPLLGSFCSQV